MDKISLVVRLAYPLSNKSKNSVSSSSPVTVFVDESDRGCDVRNAVGHLTGHQPSAIRLIFAGKLVDDASTVKELEICNNTTIYAVATLGNAVDADPLKSISRESFGSSQAIASRGLQNDGLKSTFYVYCKSSCQSVQCGKLRVACSQCSQDAFTVSKDPSCWDDVLKEGRIPGKCHIPSCQGRQAKFYFKCASHCTSGDDNVVPLPLIRMNLRRIECLTCGDITSPIVVFDCSPLHAVCLECFTHYCRFCLNERRFIHSPELGYTLRCPARCENSLIRETHHFLVMGKEQYTRYKQFGAEECLLREGGVLCPSPGCGAGIIPHNNERKVICEQEGGFGCGFVFCRNCQEEYHEGECGQRNEEQHRGQRSSFSFVDLEKERLARWEREQSLQTIERTSKPCPKCRVPTERNGGCMHMTCSQTQCKFEWCWLCHIQWNTECLADHWFGTDPI